MAERNRNRSPGSDSHREGGMSGASSGRGDDMSGMGGSSRSGGFSGSGSDRSSSNIGRSPSKTSGSREESMHGSSQERSDELDRSRRHDDDSGSMHGSSSGTTGLGGDRNQTSTGAPGGVEGVSDKANPSPDEDRARIQ